MMLLRQCVVSESRALPGEGVGQTVSLRLSNAFTMVGYSQAAYQSLRPKPTVPLLSLLPGPSVSLWGLAHTVPLRIIAMQSQWGLRH